MTGYCDRVLSGIVLWQGIVAGYCDIVTGYCDRVLWQGIVAGYCDRVL